MILGTAQLGLNYGISNQEGKPNSKVANELLKFAWENNIRTLDTASAYGDSENVIGDSGISEFNIISKLPKIEVSNNKDLHNHILNQIKRSLDNTNQVSLDSYLLHSVEDLMRDKNSIWNEMLSIKEKRYSNKIGYSVYTINQLEEVYDKFKPDVIQLPFSVLDRQFYSSGWIERMKGDGVEIHVRSIFLQGLLLMDINDQRKRFPGHQRLWIRWNDFLSSNNISALQACLGFVQNHKEIDHIVVGVNNKHELSEILNFTNFKISISEKISSTDPELIYPFKWN